MDGMTGDPPFLFCISKGDLTMIVYVMFHGFLNVEYFANGHYVLDVTFTLSNTILVLRF